MDMLHNLLGNYRMSLVRYIWYRRNRAQYQCTHNAMSTILYIVWAAEQSLVLRSNTYYHIVLHMFQGYRIHLHI